MSAGVFLDWGTHVRSQSLAVAAPRSVELDKHKRLKERVRSWQCQKTARLALQLGSKRLLV